MKARARPCALGFWLLTVLHVVERVTEAAGVNLTITKTKLLSCLPVAHALQIAEFDLESIFIGHRSGRLRSAVANLDGIDLLDNFVDLCDQLGLTGLRIELFDLVSYECNFLGLI